VLRRSQRVFVYIIGNADQNIFKLGMASDPFQKLSSLQEGNPYKLSIFCKVCAGSKNEAALVEALGRRELAEYEGAGGWYTSVPEVLSAQFASDHYLRRLAGRAEVTLSDAFLKGRRNRGQQTASKGRTNLQRLSPIVKRDGLTFEEVLERVEQAYEEGRAIDSLLKS